MQTEDAGGLTLDEEMAANGFTPEEIELYKTDPAEFDRRMAQELPEDLKPAGTGPPPTQWPPLRRFTDAKVEPFPVHALPWPVASYVEALAVQYQVDPILPGLSAVGCLAAACQSWAVLKVRDGWRESLNIYEVNVDEPGTKKSPCLKDLMMPLTWYEGERMRREAGEVRANQTARKILEGQLSKAEQQAASGKDGAKEQAMRLAHELADFKDIHPYRLLLDDATPEKLTDEMAKQGGCLAVWSTEANVFDSMMGRYSKQPNLDIFLKSFSGDPVRVDRVGRPGCQIDNPRLSLILTCQPDALADVVQNKQARGRGLPARFLYGICRTDFGNRDTSPTPAPPDLKKAYDDLLLDLLEKSTGPEITLTMSPEADKMRDDFQLAIEKRLAPGARWCDMRDFGGKFVGTICRIAGLLKLADDASDHYGDPWTEKEADPSATKGNEVNADEMARAIRIAVCLGNHAERAYGLGSDDGEDLARKAAQKLEAAGKGELTRRELRRMLHCTADELEERNYIRLSTIKPAGRGRTKEIIECNPEIWKMI